MEDDGVFWFEYILGTFRHVSVDGGWIGVRVMVVGVR